MRRTFFFTLTLFFGSSALFGADGFHLYKQHCAACHGQQGERKAWNVTSPIAGWSIDTVKNAMIAYKDKSRNLYGYGDFMHPQATNYSPGQIHLIAEYIASLQPIPDTIATRGE